MPCRRPVTPRKSNVAGLTLVEAVTGLLIVAVLAVVALPRYADQETKAREARVKSLAQSMHAVAALVKASAEAQGISCAAARGNEVDIEATPIALAHCYPQALPDFGAGILAAAKVGARDGWLLGTTPPRLGGDPPTLTVQVADAATPQKCAAVYRAPAGAGQAPDITATLEGC